MPSSEWENTWRLLVVTGVTTQEEFASLKRVIAKRFWEGISFSRADLICELRERAQGALLFLHYPIQWQLRRIGAKI